MNRQARLQGAPERFVRAPFTVIKMPHPFAFCDPDAEPLHVLAATLGNVRAAGIANIALYEPRRIVTKRLVGYGRHVGRLPGSGA